MLWLGLCSDEWIWKGAKEAAVARLDAVSRSLPARTEKNMEISDSQSFGRDLNLWPPEYKSEMLLYAQTYYGI